jgi:hypothetical protein
MVAGRRFTTWKLHEARELGFPDVLLEFWACFGQLFHDQNPMFILPVIGQPKIAVLTRDGITVDILAEKEGVVGGVYNCRVSVSILPGPKNSGPILIRFCPAGRTDYAEESELLYNLAGEFKIFDEGWET